MGGGGKGGRVSGPLLQLSSLLVLLKSQCQPAEEEEANEEEDLIT